MPIYAYRCAECGHAKDVLQKMSDAPLTDCPVCGASRFEKQLTAAGFQLKGSGWYVTDFRNNGAPAKSGAKSEAKSDDTSGGKADAPSETKQAATSEPSSSPAASPAPAAAPAPSAPSSSTS